MTVSPQLGGWILYHVRATDVVCFGPFASTEEAEQWMRDVGNDHRVRGLLIPLVSPASDPMSIWNDLEIDWKNESK